jgi:U3 small nucleolar RNA-associated protein 20
MLVTNPAVGVRQQCSQLFLEFLLHYPLGKVRLQQHLDYLLNNLSFEYESGREAVLDTLHFIFQKFPQAIINNQAEYFFLPLVVRLVNDDSSRCRQLVAETLKSFFKAIDTAKLDSISSLVLSWYTNDANEQLQQAASQVITILFEVCGKNLQQRVSSVLPAMLSKLESAKAHTAKDASTINVAWETTYFTMTALEKLIGSVPSVMDLVTVCKVQ